MLNARRILANEVAEAYIAENLGLKEQLSESASEWLEDRLAALESRTKHSEIALYDFKKQADMLTTSLEDRVNMVSQTTDRGQCGLTDVKLRDRRAYVRASTRSIIFERALTKTSPNGPTCSRFRTRSAISFANSRLRMLTPLSNAQTSGNRYLQGRILGCTRAKRSFVLPRRHCIANSRTSSRHRTSNSNESLKKETNLLALFERDQGRGVRSQQAADRARPSEA